MKNAIQWKYFQKRKLKPCYWKNPKTLKLYPQTWYVKEKFQVIVECYILLEGYLNIDFDGIIFWNVDWNYYHLKPQTRNILLKSFLIILTYYISLKRSWKIIFDDNVFEKGERNYTHLYTFKNKYIWIGVIILFCTRIQHCGLLYEYHRRNVQLRGFLLSLQKVWT